MQSTTPVFIRFVLMSASAMIVIACDRPKHSEGEPTTKTAIELYDSDEDGVLSETEKSSMNQKFVEQFDSDGDGKISSKERVETRKQSQTTITVTKKTADSDVIAQALILRVDRNKDEMISSDEVDEKRWAVISRADKNGDNKVDSEEWISRDKK